MIFFLSTFYKLKVKLGNDRARNRNRKQVEQKHKCITIFSILLDSLVDFPRLGNYLFSSFTKTLQLRVSYLITIPGWGDQVSLPALDLGFPRARCQPEREGALTYYLAKFYQKLQENEESWTERGRASKILLCRSATGYYLH